MQKEELQEQNPSDGLAENDTKEKTDNSETKGKKAKRNKKSKPNWQEKYQSTYDEYLRLFSEFDNFRKRTQKERIDLIKTSHADIMSALLPVIDDFGRAFAASSDGKNNNTIDDGIKLIYQKLMQTLKDKGLQEMDVLSKAFDPEMHEAITEIPAQNKKDKGKVVDVVEKGYMLNERIIRYPKVVVAK